MVLDRQKVWMDGQTEGMDGQTDGRRQNYIPPTSSGDNNWDFSVCMKMFRLKFPLEIAKHTQFSCTVLTLASTGKRCR